MFGGDNKDKDHGMEILGIMVAMVTLVGTFFILTYKGAAKITKWGMAKRRDRKERERISKL